MVDEVKPEGVSRTEFYGIVSLLFVGLAVVVFTVASEDDGWRKTIPQILLLVTFLGAGMWFTLLSARERKRQKNANEGATEPGPAPDRGVS